MTEHASGDSAEGEGVEPGLDDENVDDLYEQLLSASALPEAPGPVNWNLLRAHELETEWLELNQWVDWLRRTYGLPAAIVPPFWHRHPELLWELSALRSHWLSSYDPEQAATGPIAWHKEFAAARLRLRDWVAICGTRLDTDRPTRQTTWPGEEPQPPIEDERITDRRTDFIDFVATETEARKAAEDAALREFFNQRKAREP